MGWSWTGALVSAATLGRSQQVGQFGAVPSRLSHRRTSGPRQDRKRHRPSCALRINRRPAAGMPSASTSGVVAQSTGDFSLARWVDDADGRNPFQLRAEDQTPRGCGFAGFGTGGSVGLVAAAEDARRSSGVAVIGAPADFDDWAAKLPSGSLAHAREVEGDQNSTTTRRTCERWNAELREVRAVEAAEQFSPRDHCWSSTAPRTRLFPTSMPGWWPTPTGRRRPPVHPRRRASAPARPESHLGPVGLARTASRWSSLTASLSLRRYRVHGSVDVRRLRS